MLRVRLERAAEPDGVYQLCSNRANFHKDLRLQSHNPWNEYLLVLKKEGTMPLYGRLNESVSRLPRVWLQELDTDTPRGQ